MIDSIKLENFKQFDNLQLSCRASNVVIGPNNSGKSTTLDALRIYRDVVKYANRNKPFFASHDGYGVCATYQVPESLLSVNISNIVYNYSDEDASITIKVKTGASLIIKIHPHRGCIAFIPSDKFLPRNTTEFRRLFPYKIVVVPTLAAFEDPEFYVQDETVARNENTRLASRNFRNILLRKNKEQFLKFQNLCSDSWIGIELEFPRIERSEKPIVTMMYREKRIAREISWAGFGFQVWMQLMIHFVDDLKNCIIVCDEPDVYVHPELQRRFLKLCKAHFEQLFIATHSNEIINESDEGDIIIIDSKRRTAKRITNDEDYKLAYAHIGSSDNVEFARIARSRRIVFFEGKDRKFLRRISNKIGLDAVFDDQYTTYLQAGGYSQWKRVVEIEWSLKNLFGLDVKVAAIFDRDYRSDHEISEFIKEISARGLKAIVLDRKEIENYALSLEPLLQCMISRIKIKSPGFDRIEALPIVEKITEEMHEDCRAQIIKHYVDFHEKRQKDIDRFTHLKNALAKFDTDWSCVARRLEMLCGKDFIVNLNRKLQETYKCSITVNQMLEEISSEKELGDIAQKLRDLSAFLK